MKMEGLCCPNPHLFEPQRKQRRDGGREQLTHEKKRGGGRRPAATTHKTPHVTVATQYTAKEKTAPKFQKCSSLVRVSLNGC